MWKQGQTLLKDLRRDIYTEQREIVCKKRKNCAKLNFSEQFSSRLLFMQNISVYIQNYELCLNYDIDRTLGRKRQSEVVSCT